MVAMSQLALLIYSAKPRRKCFPIFGGSLVVCFDMLHVILLGVCVGSKDKLIIVETVVTSNIYRSGGIGEFPSTSMMSS